MSFTSPVLFSGDKLINVIHDLTCWDYPATIPVKMKYYYRYAFHIAARKSWKIVTVSNYSQKRICEHYGLPRERVPVVYDGLTGIFCEKFYESTDLRQKYGLPQRYILSLSTLEPRKNLRLLIEAYKELAEDGVILPDLVLAGRQGWKLEDIIADITGQIKEKIHFTGFIQDSDLPQIYRDAEVFVFPSLYEGFGIPIIEAMSQGTIVISSDSSSLPEVGGDAAIYFKNNSLEGLKNAFKCFYELSETEKERQRELGFKQCNKFDWKVEAEKYYKAITDNW